MVVCSRRQCPSSSKQHVLTGQVVGLHTFAISKAMVGCHREYEGVDEQRTSLQPPEIGLECHAMPNADYRDPAWTLGETIVDRYDSTVDHDDYTQPGNLYRMFDDAHRDRLATRIAGVLGQARKEVQMRQLCHFWRADEDYGRRVAEKLGIDMSELEGMMPAAGATA